MEGVSESVLSKELILVILLSKNPYWLTAGLGTSHFGSRSEIPKSMPWEALFLFQERNFAAALVLNT